MEETPGQSKVGFWKNKHPVGSNWKDEVREALAVAERDTSAKHASP
jgi:hypothetical protein